MDWQKHNIKVYDKFAKELSEYFSGIGPRVDDIERAIKFAEAKNNARVIEIGCGDGRDANEIIKRVKHYEGFDPSKKMIDIARSKNPDTSFIVDDAISYRYPKNIDIIYAFASILHVNIKDLEIVFGKVFESLRRGGIFYISSKEKSEYAEEVKNDVYGERLFYYYNPKIIEKIVGDKFEIVFESHNTIGHTDWFTIALRKK